MIVTIAVIPREMVAAGFSKDPNIRSSNDRKARHVPINKIIETIVTAKKLVFSLIIFLKYKNDTPPKMSEKKLGINAVK